MNTVTEKEKGFTIIEVVLVIAIGALIMLMVFLALPALQRGQRDTARKNDLSRLQAAIGNYKSTNKGRLPTLDATFVTGYMTTNGDTFADPKGTNATYTLAPMVTGTPAYTEATVNNIYYNYGGTCGTGSAPAWQNPQGSAATTRKLIIVKPLEGGGYQCQEV